MRSRILPKSNSRTLRRIEEAKRRDHRRVGKELDLYSFTRSPGAVSSTQGQIIWDEIARYWKAKHRDAGYDEVRTPFLLNEELWHKSGHMTTTVTTCISRKQKT